MLEFCREASELVDNDDDTDYFAIQEMLNHAAKDAPGEEGELKYILKKMIRTNNSGSKRYMFELFNEEKSCNPNEHIIKWERETPNEPPGWTKSLKLPAARGRRRFRMIQSLWQDIHSIGVNLNSINEDELTKIRAQGDSEKKSFVYLDCIQLGDLLWQDKNWIRCFTKARMLAPIIEVLLFSFISAFDTLYPNSDEDDLEFGPMALGGDELHIVVPEDKISVEKIISKIDNNLLKQINDYGLVGTREWRLKKKTGRLVLDKKISVNNPHVFCPKRMWWFGIVDLNADDSSIDDLLNQIKEMKNRGRKSWKYEKEPKTMFYTLL